MHDKIAQLIREGFTMPQIEKMLFLRREQDERVREEQKSERKHQEFLKYLVEKGILKP